MHRCHYCGTMNLRGYKGNCPSCPSSSFPKIKKKSEVELLREQLTIADKVASYWKEQYSRLLEAYMSVK